MNFALFKSKKNVDLIIWNPEEPPHKNKFYPIYNEGNQPA